MSLHTKMIQVMKACAYATKDGKNTSQNYTYVSDEQLMRLVNSALCEQGIATYVTSIRVLGVETFKSAKGTEFYRTRVEAVFELVDSDTGESRHIVGLGEGSDIADKAAYKALTGARKYAFRLALNIATGDDAEKDSVYENDGVAPVKQKGRRPGKSAIGEPAQKHLSAIETVLDSAALANIGQLLKQQKNTFSYAEWSALSNAFAVKNNSLKQQTLGDMNGKA